MSWTEEELVRSLLLQFTETSPAAPPQLIDKQTQAAWVVPHSGFLNFEFEVCA
jgi:hypothetical protein